MFSSVLIANRGEIACRIIETARHLGVRCIAVYSAVDAKSRHVRLADEAHLIGGPEPHASYLNIENILNIAEKTGAEALHPGYGFLAENADFAEKCAKAGIVFIGPSPEAMRAMGAKDAAKALMEKANVPIVPGYHGSDQSANALAKHAEKIGYPVLIKPVMGGGGRGMRLVEKSQEFADALESAKREAKTGFGDDRVLIEKFIENPRHIEIQIFGDNHGQIVHLFERDCSAQRRHQKVIEEAPAPGMSQELRQAMGAAAIKAAQAVDYTGAGTVEFIVPGEHGLNKDTPFYFMEMNTRLQVEHPVTELVTRQDLVAWQFNIAAGEKLPLAQGEIILSGHAIEARLYAEDASSGFLPQTGRLEAVNWPEMGEGLRIDRGVDQGDQISPYYDAMIAKLIVSGPTREIALNRLISALKELKLAGLVTNKGFLTRLLGHPLVQAGGFDTGLIDQEIDKLIADDKQEKLLIFACLAWLVSRHHGTPNLGTHRQNSVFDRLSGWQLGNSRTDKLTIIINGVEHSAYFHWQAGRLGAITLDQGTNFEIGQWRFNDKTLNAEIAGASFSGLLVSTTKGVLCDAGFTHFHMSSPDHSAGGMEEGSASGFIRAPMPGKVTALNVKPDDRVEKGAVLCVLEAMKMEHALPAPFDALVKEVRTDSGIQVSQGDILIILEPIAD